MSNTLGIETKEIRKLIRFNYPFISVVGLIIAVFSQVYKIVPLWIVLFTIFVNLLATFIVHYLALRKAWAWVQTAGLVFLSIVLTATTTYGITFFSAEAMPTALLIFIPSIIMQASLSLSFGTLSLAIVAIAGAGLYFEKIYFLPDTTSQGFFLFIYFFLMVLGFLANYTMEILRRKEREIQRIAKINEDLYQLSKSTSDEVIKNMQEALVVVDENFKISRYNNSFLKIFSENKDLINQDFTALANDIGLDIKPYTEEIKKNELDNTITVSTKDTSNNQYDNSISQINLRDNEKGFLIIISKKQSPWGKIYESDTKKPVHLAIVRLMRADKDKIVAIKVTDDQGNFSFIVPDGDYRITVAKEGYLFPSELDQKSYHGEVFHASNNLINFDIALDAQKEKE